MTSSVKLIPVTRLAELSRHMTLYRSKYLGRLKVVMGERGEGKTYVSSLVKNTIKHLKNAEQRPSALEILTRLKELSAPKPETLIARIIQAIARIFSKDVLTKLKNNSDVARAERAELPRTLIRAAKKLRAAKNSAKTPNWVEVQAIQEEGSDECTKSHATSGQSSSRTGSEQHEPDFEDLKSSESKSCEVIAESESVEDQENATEYTRDDTDLGQRLRALNDSAIYINLATNRAGSKSDQAIEESAGRTDDAQDTEIIAALNEEVAYKITIPSSFPPCPIQ